MHVRRWLALLAVPAATLALTTPAMASTTTAAKTSGTEIILADTAFGPALAVGSGPYKNYTLYYITSDHGSSYGCTTGPTKTQARRPAKAGSSPACRRGTACGGCFRLPVSPSRGTELSPRPR